MELPVLVTSQLTFDTGSDLLVKGESAIVYAVDQEDGAGSTWMMMSIDRPRLIQQRFKTCSPEQVLKRWLKPDA